MLRLLIILFFAATFAQFLISNIKLLKSPSQDFEVFYLSGQQALARQNPYLKLGKDIVRNPPPAILLFMLFPIFPVELSQTLWFITSIFSFTLGSYLLFKTLNISNWKIWLVYFSLVFLFFPFRYNLGSGQVNNFLFLLITFTFYLSKRQKSFWAAVSLVLAIVLKITPIFLLLTLFWQKQVKIILFALINTIVLGLITSVVLGPQVYKDYLTIPNSFLDFGISSYYNQSLSGFLMRIFGNPQLSQSITLITLVLGLVVFSYLVSKSKQKNLNNDLIFWNISIIYMLIFAPFAWQYHFVILIFPLITTAYLGYKSKLTYKFFLPLALSYILTAWNIKNPILYSGFLGSIILSHLFFGVVLLLFLNYYLAKKSE